MEPVGTVVNALVVGVVGLLLAWLGKGRFEAIDRRFEAVDHRFDRLEDRLEAFRAELNGRIDALSARLDAHLGRHAD